MQVWVAHPGTRAEGERTEEDTSFKYKAVGRPAGPAEEIGACGGGARAAQATWGNFQALDFVLGVGGKPLEASGWGGVFQEAVFSRKQAVQEDRGSSGVLRICAEV